MFWLFFALTVVAIAGLVAYIRLAKAIWQRQRHRLLRKLDNFFEEDPLEKGIPSPRELILPATGIVARSYGWPDVLVGLILGAYFLRMVASSSEVNPIPTLREIEVGTIFYVLLDLLILAFLMLRRIHPLQVFGFRSMRGFQIFKWALLWLIALYPIIFLVQLLVENLWGTDVTPQPLVQYLMENKRIFNHLSVGLLAVIVAPFTEELIFRGYLYGVLRQYAGRLAAIIVTSCIFAGIHQHLSAFPGLFLLAVALCLVYEATGCLTVAMVMHALFNLIGVLAAIFGPH